MIADLVLAFLVTGFITGWLTRTVFVMAQISRSQERMQRKVRYWQGEAARARVKARQLACQLAALGVMPVEDQDCPPPDDGYR
jgi:hypothetical protein